MTNNRYTMTPLPADADCAALMIALIRDAANDLLDSSRYFADRFDIISDYDDYAPAAARLATATTDRFLAHIDATPRDALLALLDDDDFIDDIMTADFNTPLFDLINIDYRD